MEKKSNCYVTKVSKTGKSIYVAFKRNKYQIGYAFGWCANADNLEVGNDVQDFYPKGRVQMLSIEGELMFHKPVGDAEPMPVMQWVFE